MTYSYPTAFSHWDHEEEDAALRVYRSGRYTAGPEVEAFEHELASFHGRKHAIMTNSGSSANLVMVRALIELGLLKNGGRVRVPAISWSTMYAPFVQFGIDLVLMDVDDTWNGNGPVDIIDGATAMVGCSILGNPAHLDGMEVICKQDGLILLNDDCESMGARLNERTTASYGFMATQSFFYSHQLSGIEGGAVLTDDDDCARVCRLLVNHGNEGFVKPTGDFDESYRFTLMGFNLRGLELHAAIARAQLAKLDRFVLARNENLAYFWTYAGELQRDGKLIRPRVNGSMSPFGLHFECEDNNARSRLVPALRQEGIDCRLPTGGSFRRHPYGKKWEAQRTDRADQIHERGLFLGNAPFPIEDKIDRAVKIMREVL